MTRPARILFVVTSTATMGEGGDATGLWLEEFTVPYVALTDAAQSIEVVSTVGGVVPIDPRSLTDEAFEIPENRRYRDDPALQRLLHATRPVDRVRFAEYDTIFLPGGHGTMWDLPHCQPLAGGIGEMLTAGKPVAAVCHGPSGLLGAKLWDGRPAVAGRWVAAFTTEEEIAVGLRSKVPFLLDEKLVALGARVIKGEPFVPLAVAHANLITGQNPQSAREVAGLVLAALRRPQADEAVGHAAS